MDDKDGAAMDANIRRLDVDDVPVLAAYETGPEDKTSLSPGEHEEEEGKRRGKEQRRRRRRPKQPEAKTAQPPEDPGPARRVLCRRRVALSAHLHELAAEAAKRREPDEAKHYRAALAADDDAVAADPRCVEAWAQRALTQHALKDFSGALASVAAAAELQRGDSAIAAKAKEFAARLRELHIKQRDAKEKAEGERRAEVKRRVARNARPSVVWSGVRRDTKAAFSQRGDVRGLSTRDAQLSTLHV
eukprot:COSAG04_NODE_4090_length_2308_cov_1.460842_1_plen_246_part_00